MLTKIKSCLFKLNLVYLSNKPILYMTRINLSLITFYVIWAVFGVFIQGCATSVMIPYTYVDSINTTKYNKAIIKSILDEFNEMGDNVIVKYKKGIRPITITEVEDFSLLGEAYVRTEKCEIIIKKGLDFKLLRETVLHEYLHCFDYDHIKVPGDLMYPSDAYEASEASIKDYAKDLHRKFYGKP